MEIPGELAAQSAVLSGTTEKGSRGFHLVEALHEPAKEVQMEAQRSQEFAQSHTALRLSRASELLMLPFQK